MIPDNLLAPNQVRNLSKFGLLNLKAAVSNLCEPSPLRTSEDHLGGKKKYKIQ
jgi:hypothetical protein